MLSKTFLFQAFQFNQTVLIPTIQFSISMQLVLFDPLILPGATTPDESGPGSNGNEGLLRIPQSFSITGPSPSDCLVSYPGWGTYPSAEKQSVYSIAPTNWATDILD